MATQFKNWANGKTDTVLSASEFANNEDVVNGFKGGNPASAKNTNSGLRQANLFATGAMEALAEIQSVLPVDNLNPHIINDRGTIDANTLSLTSPVSTIKDFVKLPYNSLARRVSVNEGAIGDNTSGLTKKVNDNTAAIQTNATNITNLNNDITALNTAVGNDTSGLIKKVNDNTAAINSTKRLIQESFISGRNDSYNSISSSSNATSIGINVFTSNVIPVDYAGVWQLFFKSNLSIGGTSIICASSITTRVHSTSDTDFNQTFHMRSVNTGASYLRCVIKEFQYTSNTVIHLTIDAYLAEGISGTISTSLVSCVANYLGTTAGYFPN